MKCENMVFTRHNFFYKYISLSSVLSSEKEKNLHKKTVEETEFLSFFIWASTKFLKYEVKDQSKYYEKPLSESIFNAIVMIEPWHSLYTLDCTLKYTLFLQLQNIELEHNNTKLKYNIYHNIKLVLHMSSSIELGNLVFYSVVAQGT